MSSLLRLYTSSFSRSPYITLLITNATLMSIGDLSAQALSAYTLLQSAAPESTSSFASAFAAAYDPLRTARFGFFGGAVGPVLGSWNKFLEDRFPLKPVRLATSSPSQVNDRPPTFDLPKGVRWERSPANEKRMKEEKEFAGRNEKTAGKGASAAEDKVSLMALGKRVAVDQLMFAPVSLLFFLVSMALLDGLQDDEIMDKVKQNYFSILLANWQVWPVLQMLSFRFVPLRYRVPVTALAGIAWTCFLSTKIEKPLEVAAVDS